MKKINLLYSLKEKRKTMNRIKYLIEVEKYLYKYTLIGDNNLINFFKKEEKEIISNLSIEEKIATFDELVYNTDILDENIATEFSIVYQFNNHLKKLPLKRLANILITDIFTLCPSLLGVKNYSQNKPYRNQYQKYCYKHYLN